MMITISENLKCYGIMFTTVVFKSNFDGCCVTLKLLLSSAVLDAVTIISTTRLWSLAGLARFALQHQLWC